MAKTPTENPFIKKATKMGLEQMLRDINMMLGLELTEAQTIMNEEMKTQILRYLEELK